MLNRVFLTFAADIYRGVTTVRNKLYDLKLLPIYQSKLPIICVGNLTVGGNGKTPLVRFLVREMKGRGYEPVVLSRGYGGKIKGPHIVASNDSFNDVGDETLLISNDGLAPVVVAKDRVKGAKFIEEQKLGTLIILDDGMQHRRLARDLNIVCVSCSSKQEIDAFISGELLPLGRFREDKNLGLQRARIVMLSSRTKESVPIDPKFFGSFSTETTVFRSLVKPLKIELLNRDQNFSAKKVVAFSGIANPTGFFTTLKELGHEVLYEKAFPDHHVFSEKDIKDLIDMAPDNYLITTEKDAIRLQGLSDSFKQKIAVLKIDTQVTPHDAFLVQVQKEISKK